MYFFSELDPNFRIKGSRDPLGFQSLWANAGHKLIAHLSTVSGNLRDFMILSYGFYFFGERDERKFLDFFIKFEQVCAYARRIFNSEGGFNGIEYVEKHMDEKQIKNKFTFSHNVSDLILSNQRAYGIYGKYIRPFRDMKIAQHDDFRDVLTDSLKKTDKEEIIKLTNKILDSGRETVSFVSDELRLFGKLIKKKTNLESEFYRNRILKVPNESHPQNILYNILINKKEILNIEGFHLYNFISTIKKDSLSNESLNFVLNNIEQTERVLYPLNTCFSHLLSNSFWDFSKIKQEPLFKQLPNPIPYSFEDEKVNKLNTLYSLHDVDFVRQLIEQNKKVSHQRGNMAWIEETNKGFHILYGDWGKSHNEINTRDGCENSYFIPTYLNLFKEIEKPQ